MNTILQYILFCAISMVVNIAAQEISQWIYAGQFAVELSIIAGTGAGLVVKYVLDKKFIFKHSTSSHKENAQTFFLYSLMGVATTVIFWGTEYTFELLFKTKSMRYLGAVIGLTIGYYVKYLLDKRFVFKV